MKKDVKVLLKYVEEKLLKSIHEKPSKETLDKLAIFVGFQDWESFRNEVEEDKAEKNKDKDE